MDVTPSHLVALRLSSTAVVSERISGGRKRSAGTGCVFFFTWAKSRVYFWVEGDQEIRGQIPALEGHRR